MKRVIAAIALGMIVAAGCGGDDDGGGGSERPGNPAVYERIDGMTDCAALQAEFDQADENHDIQSAENDLPMMEISTSYMDAADARMQEVGCYD